MNAPVIAIDPGREKCGVAVVDWEGKILAHCIVVPEKIAEAVGEQLKDHQAELIILGDATASREAWELLQSTFPQVQVISVPEKNSTLEAREIYWRENPPSGWRKIVPLSLQVPPVPIDDYAAVVLALRYWTGRS
jgi:RNase H-fold protein (predicted Holliday junction resolvase)